MNENRGQREKGKEILLAEEKKSTAEVAGSGGKRKRKGGRERGEGTEAEEIAGKGQRKRINRGKDRNIRDGGEGADMLPNKNTAGKHNGYEKHSHTVVVVE